MRILVAIAAVAAAALAGGGFIGHMLAPEPRTVVKHDLYEQGAWYPLPEATAPPPNGVGGRVLLEP